MSTADVAIARWSLRQRLTKVLVLTALVPALLFGVALLRSQWLADHDSLLLRLDSNARINADALDDFLEAQLSGVELLADHATNDAAHAANLEGLMRAFPTMLRALHADREGRVVTAYGREGVPAARAEPVMGDRDWFVQARDARRGYVSNAYRAKVFGDEALVAVSAPILKDGQFDGVLQASMPVDLLVASRSQNLQRRGFELLVLDRVGRVVYASSNLRWSFLDDPGAAAAEMRRNAMPATQSGDVRVMKGVLRDSGDAYVDAVAMRNGWLLVLLAPRQKLYEPFIPRLGMFAALLVLTTLGVLWALWRQRRLLRDSIGYLLASLRGYALGGRLDTTQIDNMPEELAPLASGIGDLSARMNAAFDELQSVLDEREHVIEERTESLRQAVSDLDRLSRTDALTGSLNYRGFQEAGEELWRAAKDAGQPLSVLALDIDHFKRYNDLYGHVEGDGALRRFAGAVRSALLHADDVLARPGGEEFTVFLPGSTLEQATLVAQRICQRVRDADIAHAASPKGRMTVSVGIAAMEATDSELEQMLLRADEALYRAKEAGRDGFSA